MLTIGLCFALILTISALPSAPSPPLRVRVPLPPELETISDSNADEGISLLLTNLNATLIKYGAEPLAEFEGLERPLSAQRRKRDGVLGIEFIYSSFSSSVPRGYSLAGPPIQDNEIGPSRLIPTIFDTGSADYYIPGPLCTPQNGCGGIQRYGNTGVNRGTTTRVGYASGWASGDNFLDNVTVGGLTARDTNIVSLRIGSGLERSVGQTSARMGMAFGVVAQTGQMTFMERLMNQNPTMTKEFSFYHKRWGPTSSVGLHPSEMTIGGRAKELFTGPVTRIPVMDQKHWSITLLGVKARNANMVDEYIYPPAVGRATVDTGSNTIILPPTQAAALWSFIPRSFPIPLAGPSGVVSPPNAVAPVIYAYPCPSLTTPEVPISFIFAGFDFRLDPMDLNTGRLSELMLQASPGNLKLKAALGSGEEYCVGSIVGASMRLGYAPGEIFVIGIPFLKSWYSIFSYVGNGSVSFAKAVDRYFA